MGKDAKIRHMRKFAGGQMSAQDMHRKVALRGKKCPCGLDAAGRCITFAPLSELMSREPLFLVHLARQHGGSVPMVHLRHHKDDTTGEKHVRVGMAYYCELCKPACEKQAAKGPSWILHEFDDGPAADKAVVQMPGEAAV